MDCLQGYLNDIEHWAIQNCLRINAHKSAAMRFSNSSTAGRPTYTNQGPPLAVPRSLTILGVTYSPILDFPTHILGLVGKARRTLGLVARASKQCGPDTSPLLYTVLVLPVLEYYCSIWSPLQLHLAKKGRGCSASSNTHLTFPFLPDRTSPRAVRMETSAP